MKRIALRIGVAMLALVACSGVQHLSPQHPAAADLPPPSAAVAAYSEPVEFAGTLAAHSRWRQQVGTPDLVWSDAAARHAQDWADALARERTCEPAHSPGAARRQTLGENVFSYFRGGEYEGFRRSATYVVDSWGSEVRWYRAEGNRCEAPAGEVCGHYTQVVSTYSTHVGCGRARCPRAEVWVCNYAPPGNYQDVPPF